MARRRRSNFDLIGRWLFFFLLPWLVGRLCALIAWPFLRLWGRKKPKLLPGQKPGFLKSQAWRTARVKCMELNKQQFGHLRCMQCGRTELQGVESWHCHHIRSRSNWPELALAQDNLTMLCDDCNMGMSNRYQDLDFTPCSRKYH